MQFGNFTVDVYNESTRTIYELARLSHLFSRFSYRDPSPSIPVYVSEPVRTNPGKGIQVERARISGGEHGFDKQFQKDPVFQDFVRELEFQPPLNPREALYGGRTNATRLYCCEGDMRYVDVCSLYPYVLKYKPFPLGHPEIITEDFQDVRSYFGLIQCRVLPPRGMYHPVLPYRTGGK